MSKTLSDASCALCGQGPLRKVRAYRPQSGIFCTARVARCERCGLMQVVPMPSGEELESFYRSTYRSEAQAWVCSPYDDLKELNFRTASQVEFIKKHVSHAERIVDVGCGYGQLLKCLRDTFPEAKLFGVEISEKCQPALKQLGVQVAGTTLEREGGNPFGEGFDVLTCSHVLEHSCQVAKFLGICAQLSREGGFVMFEVPNCEFEYGCDVPHLTFFTPKALAQALQSAGFEVLSCQPCGPTAERWQYNRRQRLQHYVEDHFPDPLTRALKFWWRLARNLRGQNPANGEVRAADLARLKEEAKDPAWFEYNKPGFKHTAIRCAATRKAAG